VEHYLKSQQLIIKKKLGNFCRVHTFDSDQFDTLQTILLEGRKILVRMVCAYCIVDSSVILPRGATLRDTATSHDIKKCIVTRGSDCRRGWDW
jgi:hypothetical protein